VYVPEFHLQSCNSVEYTVYYIRAVYIWDTYNETRLARPLVTTPYSNGGGWLSHTYAHVLADIEGLWNQVCWCMYSGGLNVILHTSSRCLACHHPQLVWQLSSCLQKDSLTWNCTDLIARPFKDLASDSCRYSVILEYKSGAPAPAQHIFWVWKPVRCWHRLFYS